MIAWTIEACGSTGHRGKTVSYTRWLTRDAAREADSVGLHIRLMGRMLDEHAERKGETIDWSTVRWEAEPRRFEPRRLAR